ISRSSVDLPDPLRPIRPVRPGPIASETPVNTGVPSGQAKSRPEQVMTGDGDDIKAPVADGLRNFVETPGARPPLRKPGELCLRAQRYNGPSPYGSQWVPVTVGQPQP